MFAEPCVISRSLDQFRRICQEAGLRLTPQRLAIFHEITAARDHPSAEEVHERLKGRMPSLSLDTVYRTLATLDDAGVVSKVQANDGRLRYDGNPEAHHHLVCKDCSRVHDFAWPGADRLRLPPEADGWGRIDRCQVELRGVCAECLKRRAAKQR